MPIFTGTGTYTPEQYIVDNNYLGSAYPTIQSAITDALVLAVPTVVYIRTGTYTEDLTLYDGITLQGPANGEAIVIGTHTPPTSGSISFANINFQQVGANGHILSSAAAGTTNINFSQCYFNIFDGYICDLASWTGTINLDLCLEASTENGIINNTSSADLNITNSTLGYGTANSMISHGSLYIRNSVINCPISFAGSCIGEVDGGSILTETLTVSTTAAVHILNSEIITLADTAILQSSSNAVLLTNVIVDCSAVPVFDGTTTISIDLVVFPTNKAFGAGLTIAYPGTTMTGLSQMENGTVLSMAAAGVVTNTAAGVLSSLSNGSDNYILTIDSGTHLPSWKIPVAGGIAWTRETSASVSAAINNGYINTNVGLTTITLPSTAALGTIIAVMGESSGGWKIAQNAGQNVQFGSVSTTSGITGSLASTNQYDVVYLVCRIADTTWSVSSVQGNLTIS
jgi:hypothetical protein